MMQVAANLDLVSVTWKGPATEHSNHDLVLLQLYSPLHCTAFVVNFPTQINWTWLREKAYVDAFFLEASAQICVQITLRKSDISGNFNIRSKIKKISAQGRYQNTQESCDRSNCLQILHMLKCTCTSSTQLPTPQKKL